MSIEEAYTKILACKMWALFGPYALRHGYSVVNDYDCSGYGKKDAIQDVLIGSEVCGLSRLSTSSYFSHNSAEPSYLTVSSLACRHFKPPLFTPFFLSQGQYDLSFVAAGDKLLDFGGHSIVQADVIKVLPAGNKAQTGKRGGKSGGKKKYLHSGLEDTVDMKTVEEKGQKKQNRRDQRDRATQGKVRRRIAPALGMTMEQAESVPGVGGLGISKPAWQ